MSASKLMVASILASLVVGGCANNKSTKEASANPYLLNQVAQEDTKYDSPRIHDEVDFQKAAQLNVRLGLSYLEKGQMERAKDKLNRALKLSPKAPEVHYAFGIYFERIGEVTKAQQAYLKAIDLNPKGGIEHNNYGAFLCRNGKYLEAEKQFLKALDDPEYTSTAQAYENMGLCVLQLPNLVKAERYFNKALMRDPNRPNALLELGYISFNKSNFTLARQYHQNYLKAGPVTARSLWLGIKLADHFNDHNLASSYRLLLKNRFPDSYEFKTLDRTFSQAFKPQVPKISETTHYVLDSTEFVRNPSKLSKAALTAQAEQETSKHS